MMMEGCKKVIRDTRNAGVVTSLNGLAINLILIVDCVGAISDRQSGVVTHDTPELSFQFMHITEFKNAVVVITQMTLWTLYGDKKRV